MLNVLAVNTGSTWELYRIGSMEKFSVEGVDCRTNDEESVEMGVSVN
jgi:hypothetical protein